MAVNYQMDVINPFQAALQGYGAGAQILQQERTAERQVRQDEQQSQLFQAQMAEAQARAAKVQQEVAAAQERDAVYGEFYDAVEAGKLTPQLVAKVTALDEKLGTFGADMMANLSAEQKLANFGNLMGPATALATGDVEAAKANLQTQYDALTNAGDQQGANVVKGYLDQLGTPQGQTLVQAALLRGASMMEPAAFKAQLENITALKGEKETEATQTARAYAATFGAPGSPEYMRAFRTKLLPPPAPGTVVNVGGEGKPLSELQKALDKKFAEDTMLPFITGGATNDMAKVDKLVGAIATLEANPNLTGPYVGWLPDAALAVVSPDLLATKETIQDVASANLKLILGGQFGEKEGERLINRAFNQSLPASENIKRAKRMLTQVQAANEDIRRAIAYVEDPEKNGSLQGFRYSTKTGKNWTEQDFIDAIEGKNQPATIDFKAMDDRTLLRQDITKLNRQQREALGAVLTERGYD
jgi:phage tail protein X